MSDKGTQDDRDKPADRGELGRQIEDLLAELKGKDPLSAMFLEELRLFNKLAERVNQLDEQASEAVAGLTHLYRLLSDRVGMLELDRKQGDQE